MADDLYQMSEAERGEEGRAEAPGMGAGGGGSPSVSPGGRGRVAARGNVFLVALFVAGAATVYGLSLKKGPARASAEEKELESQVDSALLRLSQTASPRGTAPGAGRVSEELIRNIHRQITQRQIPLGRLHKNPFVFVPVHAVVLQPAPKAGDAREPEQNKPEEAPVDPMVALGSLRLQSIMRGGADGDSAAIINDNLLTEGQQIEGFVIKSIRSKSVVLVREGKEYTLRMQ